MFFPILAQFFLEFFPKTPELLFFVWNFTLGFDKATAF